MSLFAKQILSYIITFLVYASILPWQTALVIMGGVAFHEYGHLWASKRMGYESKGFFLFPFIGGLALSSGKTTRYSQQAFVVLMGPIWGGALALGTYVLYSLTGSAFLGQAALWMAWLNLFNLAPLSFLDGGQILESIVYSLNNTLGFFVMAISTVIAVPILWHYNPMIAVMIVVFGGTGLYSDYKKWQMNRDLKEKSGFSDAEINQINGSPKAMNWKQLSLTVICYTVTAVGLFLLKETMESSSLNMLDLFKR